MTTLNEQQVREIVEASLRPMQRAMNLEHWTISVYYERLEDGAMASCLIKIMSNIAVMKFDASQHDDKSDVLDSIRHELLHLMHGYFGVPRRMVGQHLQGDAFDAIDIGFTLADERTVSGLERLLNKFGLTPAALVEHGKKE